MNLIITNELLVVKMANQNSKFSFSAFFRLFLGVAVEFTEPNSGLSPFQMAVERGEK